MVTTICWTGHNYNSVENCRVLSAATGNDINGIIDGSFENHPFHVAYFIKTNKNWETTAFNINSDIAGKSYNQYFESNRQGNWTSAGRPAVELDGCIEIDISLTPFTNTLAVNRLQLVKKERRKITVFYVDVLKQQTRRIDQFYTKLSDTVYKYENASNNFKSLITVDDGGLVIDYPGYFIRKSVH